MPTTSDEGYAMALRWLSRRSRSRAEVRTRLKKHGIEDVESVLDRLVAHHWLSDRQVAEGEFRQAARRHQGPERIRARLYARGIEPDLAREMLSGLSTEDIEERAREALLGVISREGVPSDEQGRARVVRRLMRQGFSGAVVARALRAFPATRPGVEEDTEW